MSLPCLPLSLSCYRKGKARQHGRVSQSMLTKTRGGRELEGSEASGRLKKLAPEGASKI